MHKPKALVVKLSVTKRRTSNRKMSQVFNFWNKEKRERKTENKNKTVELIKFHVETGKSINQLCSYVICMQYACNMYLILLVSTSHVF